jgi:ABC-type glutathione transport system ATPase component
MESAPHVRGAFASEPLLEVNDLEVAYPGRGLRRKPVTVLRDISLRVPPGKTLGLVGESGSGKSTLGRAILGLAPVTRGGIRFAGRSIVGLKRGERRRLAADVQAIFQDPYSSLNPSLTIEAILSEPLVASGISRSDARRRVRELLDRVSLPSNTVTRLPREFSGGQRQRIAIARALALRPRLIVCDEPTSALDLSTQANVLGLLAELQRDSNVAYLFISHDLSVVRHISHEIAVLHHGRIVENGRAGQVVGEPEHPYTQRLLMAAPVPHPGRQRERRGLRANLLAAQAAEERAKEPA